MEDGTSRSCLQPDSRPARSRPDPGPVSAPTGKPAFDPHIIAENIKKLQPVPAVNTGHPFLDLSVKTGLAHIDATFRGDHPKYGVGTYAQDVHDGFPPTIIAAVDALSAWGMSRAPRSCSAIGWRISCGKPARSNTMDRPSASTANFCIRPRCCRKGTVSRDGGRRDTRPSIEWPSFSCNSRPRRPRPTVSLPGCPKPTCVQGYGKVFPQQRLGRQGSAALGRSVRASEGISHHGNFHGQKSLCGAGRRYAACHPQDVARRPV